MRDVGDDGIEVNPGYALGQLARALITAETHEDAETRQRAETRMEKWEAVLRGMASGALRIGSREPVAGLPAWVTPEVVRGGFATGAPAAAGALTDAERAKADENRLPHTREALFAWFLSEAGLVELDYMLATTHYRIHLPEEAALLVVAWLGRTGQTRAAVGLVGELEPFSDRLRFSPTPSDEPIGDLGLVSRETVGDVAGALDRRRENERVETQREALLVWAPFADEVLTLFLETAEDGRVTETLDESWRSRAAELLQRYRELSATHTRCTKHRKPKENLAILLSAAKELVAGRDLTDRQRGLLQHAVDAVVARRGKPGTERHSALRARQAHDGALPSHRNLASLVVSRLAWMPQDRGTPDVELVTRAVTRQEATTSGVPADTPVPRSIQRIVGRAREGTVDDLIESDLVPSAEVLARLVPQIAAQTVAGTYHDPALARLMAVHYLAFRRRRSLLLLDLEHQVGVDELPWVQAVAEHRSHDVPGDQALTAMRRIGELFLVGFPGTIMPNPLVREFEALSREARMTVPFVEEVAADIFMGVFSAKFLYAAQLAAGMLRGSLYERYYDIDYEALLRMTPDAKKTSRARTSKAFTKLCEQRSGAPADRWRVSANGMIIEQAQILTTHNLAALAGPVGLRDPLTEAWPSYAARSFDRFVELVSRTRDNPRPLGMVKDAAYAWRQMIFYLSLVPDADLRDFVLSCGARLVHLPRDIRRRAAPAVAGLQWVADGGRLEDRGVPADARRLLGWSVQRHWMLSDDRRSAGRRPDLSTG